MMAPNLAPLIPDTFLVSRPDEWRQLCDPDKQSFLLEVLPSVSEQRLGEISEQRRRELAWFVRGRK